MCGIVGYIGERKAYNILINGLTKLEYRGYDSSGIMLYDRNLSIKKTKGEIPFQYMDHKKLKKYFGWSQKYKFENTLDEVFEWYKRYLSKNGY